MSGGGLEGASEKQVRAILAKLDLLAVVVEHRTLPSAMFGTSEHGEPFIVFLRDAGGANSTAPFSHAHLSPRRSMTAVREAMAAHAAVTRDDARYGLARDAYLRQRFEDELVADGGAPALAGGTL